MGVNMHIDVLRFRKCCLTQIHRVLWFKSSTRIGTLEQGLKEVPLVVNISPVKKVLEEPSRRVFNLLVSTFYLW